MTAAELLAAAYRAHGISIQAMLDSYAAGTNLRAEVSEVTLSENESFAVYVRDGGDPGIHAAPVDADPAALGIVLDARHAEIFEVVMPITVVRCTAADFEDGKIPGVGGKGGGIQYILPPKWRAAVRRLR